jgi:hypothetical protein
MPDGYAVVPADGATNEAALQQLAFGLLWNETTWDRARGNIDGTALAQATRASGTAASSDIINYNHRGCHVVLHYSTGSANLLLRIQAKDEASDSYYNLFSTATLSSTATTVYKLFPGISVGPASINDVLPRTWRVIVVPSATLTANYGVGYSMIV